MNNSNWTIRRAHGDDLAFIYSTWVNSFRYDSSLGKSCRNSIFFPEYNRIVDHILISPETKVLVAVHKIEDNDIIIGYLVYEGPHFHYAFTKEAFRKFGVCKALFTHAKGTDTSSFTHKTFSLDPILKKYSELVYNPFPLFKQTQEQYHGQDRCSSR
jgi:hypothetical protein